MRSFSKDSDFEFLRTDFGFGRNILGIRGSNQVCEEWTKLVFAYHISFDLAQRVLIYVGRGWGMERQLTQEEHLV